MKIEITQTETKPKDIAPGTLVQFENQQSVYMVIQKSAGRKALNQSEELAEHRFYVVSLSDQCGFGEILYVGLSDRMHILEQLEPLKLKVIS